MPNTLILLPTGVPHNMRRILQMKLDSGTYTLF